MKIVASWPDYSIPAIVAVTDEGAIYTLPIVTSDDRSGVCNAFGNRWNRVVKAFLP